MRVRTCQYLNIPLDSLWSRVCTFCTLKFNASPETGVFHQHCSYVIIWYFLTLLHPSQCLNTIKDVLWYKTLSTFSLPVRNIFIKGFWRLNHFPKFSVVSLHHESCWGWGAKKNDRFTTKQVSIFPQIHIGWRWEAFCAIFLMCANHSSFPICVFTPEWLRL